MAGPAHNRLPDYIDALIRDLVAESVAPKEICQRLGIGWTTLYRRFAALGIDRPGNRRRDVAPEQVAALYAEFSEKQIAGKLGIDRNAVRRRLLEAGIKPRDRSEGMFHRMARSTDEERQRLSKAAHSAIRGVKRPHYELIKRAEAQTRIIGIDEPPLIELLKKAGLQPIHQLAVDKFNIDIAIPPVAVEVSRLTQCPPRRHILRAKAEYLLDHHWTLIWVWLRSGSDDVIDKTTANQVIALFKRTRGTPSLFGEEWVIGRHRKLPAIIQRENGKVVAGHWKDGGLTVKLTDVAGREAALAAGAQPFDPGMGRVMKEWVLVPSAHSADWLRLVEQAI